MVPMRMLDRWVRWTGSMTLDGEGGGAWVSTQDRVRTEQWGVRCTATEAWEGRGTQASSFACEYGKMHEALCSIYEPTILFGAPALARWCKRAAT